MRRLVRASLNSSIRSPRDLAKQAAATPEPAPSPASPSTSEHTTAWVTQTAGQALESPIHWLVLVPYRFHGHGFNFDPIVREFSEEETRVIIRRFMKRGLAPNDDVHAPEILIASRVVSRSHAEIWCESGGDVRDLSPFSSFQYL
jgi:E3 ubiquitin-protein ligase DMA1/2